METLIPFALLCFTSFFTLTNPLGTMPVFLTMTQGMTDKERCSIVKRATLVSFITLMVFVFAGQFLFKFFGISTNGFRIAGGVIIFKIGFDMLQARYTPMKLKDEEIKRIFWSDKSNNDPRLHNAISRLRRVFENVPSIEVQRYENTGYQLQIRRHK